MPVTASLVLYYYPVLDLLLSLMAPLFWALLSVANQPQYCSVALSPSKREPAPHPLCDINHLLRPRFLYCDIAGRSSLLSLLYDFVYTLITEYLQLNIYS